MLGNNAVFLQNSKTQSNFGKKFWKKRIKRRLHIEFLPISMTKFVNAFKNLYIMLWESPSIPNKNIACQVDKAGTAQVGAPLKAQKFNRGTGI